MLYDYVNKAYNLHSKGHQKISYARMGNMVDNYSNFINDSSNQSYKR